MSHPFWQQKGGVSLGADNLFFGFCYGKNSWLGQIGAADSQLLIVTLNYHQTQINNADYLLVDTEASKTAYGTLALTAPSEKGLYEICALVVPDPTKPNDFLPLENAYRFTLNVI